MAESEQQRTARRNVIAGTIKAPVKVVSGFNQFIKQYGVLPLAIGVVLGNAVNDLVKSIVDGLVTPFIALVSPSTTLQSFQVTFHHSVFKIGAVLNAVLSFLVIALVIYLVVKFILRNDELLEKK